MYLAISSGLGHTGTCSGHTLHTYHTLQQHAALIITAFDLTQLYYQSSLYMYSVNKSYMYFVWFHSLPHAKPRAGS